MSPDFWMAKRGMTIVRNAAKNRLITETKILPGVPLANWVDLDWRG
jgi:hypothetical protein